MNLRTRRAFSLVELMVAVFILSTSLLLIIGIFVVIFNSVQKGIDVTAGVSIGETIMSKWLFNNHSSLAAGMTESDIVTVNKVPYNYIISVSSVEGTGMADKLFRVACKMYWWERGSRSAQGAQQYYAQGYGSYSADIIRYVYKQ
ncbi:MAG: type II secretion system protein J [Vulcanimicrobiota bacterium]